MKKTIGLVLILVLLLTFTACSGNLVDTNTDTQENNTNNTADTIENTHDSNNITATMTSSDNTNMLTITGEIVNCYSDKAKNEEVSLCLQVNGEKDTLGNLSVYTQPDGTTIARYYDFAISQQIDIEYTLTDDSITFLYECTMINLDEVTDFCAYIDELNGEFLMQERFNIEDVKFADEATTKTVSNDEHDIVGIYMDVFSDSSNILEMSTDTFGYVAKLNGVDYTLTTNEQDSGNYIAYIGTSDNGERCCINVLDDKVLSVSEYYGEPEMRYTLEYTPLYTTEFYGYDKDLNRIENPIKYEFDGTNMQITIDDTYTTGWISLDEIKKNSGTLSFLQLYDIPMTSFKDDEVYFLDLTAFPKSEYGYQEMDFQSFTVYKSYFIEGEYYPNSAVISKTVIANIETDQSTKTKITDIIGTYAGVETSFGESDKPHTFEITENEIILDDKSIANINIEQLYATLIIGGNILLYDENEPTDVLTLYLDGEYLSIKIQEYGTTSELENNFQSPKNFQAPRLVTTLQKQ